MTVVVTVRQATRDDLAPAKSWLAAAGLPTDDLSEEHLREFLIVDANYTPAGMIGLERFGPVGLLRSLVVDAPLRSAVKSARDPKVPPGRFRPAPAPAQ